MSFKFDHLTLLRCQVSEQLREAYESRVMAENDLMALTEAREEDMREREAMSCKSEVLQAKIEKYGLLMSTLDINPWETPSKVCPSSTETLPCIHCLSLGFIP